MTWATLSHAEMAQRLRELLAADPPPPPRILYAAPDGRHYLSRPAGGCQVTRPDATPLGTSAGRREVSE